MLPISVRKFITYMRISAIHYIICHQFPSGNCWPACASAQFIISYYFFRRIYI